MSHATGQTAVFGVIGDPVAHSFSPQIHGCFAEKRRLNMAYLPFRVSGGDIGAALAGAWALGIRGINVTVPHKQAVIPHLADMDAVAKRIGSVNTLVWTKQGYKGYNTDHIGITRTLTSLGLSFKDRVVLVLGAGGSAYAACVAAAEGGAARIVIANRTHERAAILASHVKKHYTATVETVTFGDLPRMADIMVIQTTTLGFGAQAERSPVTDSAFFDGVELAFDFIYTPWETVFLQQARTAGVRAVNGFPMLVYQAAASFALWENAFFEPQEGTACDEALSSPHMLEALSRDFRLHADRIGDQLGADSDIGGWRDAVVSIRRTPRVE